MDLMDRISRKDAALAVVGLGYVGLPLALAFAEAGVRVVGYDVNARKIRRLREGKSYIRDISDAAVASSIGSGRFSPVGDSSLIAQADIIIVCVPTPCRDGNEPDLSFVESAGTVVSENLRRGHLVILESTSFPGTTEEVLQPILERSGLVAGRDFRLAFSPERIDPGNPRFNIKNTPKLVSGTTEEAGDLAEAVYRLVADEVLRVSSPRIAEMTKLYENTFRHINIAFANEMAMLCEKMGIDIWEVIRAASSKPFGFMPFYPGPGVGGHCIPVDPQYLQYKARQHGAELRFVTLANEVNAQMPVEVVNRIQRALDEQGKDIDGASLLVLGVAYKKDIDDVRESPALKVIEALMQQGAEVRYHDPLVDSLTNGSGELRSVELTEDELRNSDCVLICTDHSSISYEDVARLSSLVVDTRNAIRTARGRQRAAVSGQAVLAAAGSEERS